MADMNRDGDREKAEEVVSAKRDDTAEISSPLPEKSKSQGSFVKSRNNSKTPDINEKAVKTPRGFKKKEKIQENSGKMAKKGQFIKKTTDVDGDRSDGSDVGNSKGKAEQKEKLEFPCDACAVEGIAVESTNYCTECAENICTECVKQHRKFPAMRSHSILGKASRRRTSSVKPDEDDAKSYKRLLECDNHPGKPVEMYCTHHDYVWCPVCMAIEHRSCDSVSFITDNCKNVTRTKECKDLRVSIRKLKKEVESMQVKVQNNIESLGKQRNEVRNSIKAFRKRIEERLIEIEEETIKQLDKVFEKNSEEINKDVEECKKAVTDLEEIENVMETKTTDTNADFNMFVYMKRANPRMTYANEVMKRVSIKLGDERIKFFIDTKLEEWLDENYQMFGHFLYKYTTDKAPIAIQKDNEKCTITGIANLADGRFLLSDSTNRKLKLFENDFKYIDHMDMPSVPNGVSAVERSTAVVSLPDDKVVQFVNLDPQISLVNSIDVSEPCRGLSSFEGEIYVICGGNEDECQGHIRIYNMSGEIMRSIERDNLGNVLFSTPVSVFVSSFTGNIYVSDKKRGIISMKQSGELLPTVSEKSLLSPWGICEDEKRQLFVTGNGSDNIWQVRDGVPLGAILSIKDGVEGPLCIAYIARTSKIIYSSRNCNDMVICTPVTSIPNDEHVGIKGPDKHKMRHRGKKS